MSLVVLLSDQYGLCVAADTRALSTQDGPQQAPVEKLRVLQDQECPMVVVIAGEADINGIKTLDLVERLVFKKEIREDFSRLKEEIEQAWANDVANYPWDDDAEKNDYIETARISVLVAKGPDSVAILDGTPGKLSLEDYSLPRGPIGFGQPGLVRDRLNSPPATRAQWGEYLAFIFGEAQSKGDSVAEPIDLCWSSGGTFSFQRLSIEQLRNWTPN